MARMLDPVSLLIASKGTGAWSIAPEETVYKAIELMAKLEVGALLVMRDRQLTGILSERDYARKVILKGKSSRTTMVGEIMTRDVVTVAPDTPVDTCMNMMTEHRVRHLPVVESDEVKGIVSIGDLVKWIITKQETTIAHLEDYIGGRVR